MELGELMAFCTVAKLGSFSKASDRLGVAQPTISAQVRRLEKELGTPLFDRSRRPVQLTPMGAKLAQLSLPLFAELDGLLRRISSNEIEGSVRLASTPALVDHVLPSAVRTFISNWPGVRLQIWSKTIAEVLQLVDRHEADIGILPVTTSMEGLEFQPLFDYSWFLVAPLGHPILQSSSPTLGEIARWPLIMKRSSALKVHRALEEALRHDGLPYEIVLQLDTVDSIKRYVAMHLGISILPEFALDSVDLQELAFIDMSHHFPREQVGIVSIAGHEHHPLVKSFVSSLENAATGQRHRSLADTGSL
ncbi:MAG: LysR family transcriptional regulator [Dehalococcoidia bacterium]